MLSFLQSQTDNSAGTMEWRVTRGRCLSIQQFPGGSCRALLWHSHQEPPQGEASWFPGGCLVKKPLCANPGSTSLTISKLLFPRLCNHDNASTYLIG